MQNSPAQVIEERADDTLMTLRLQRQSIVDELVKIHDTDIEAAQSHPRQRPVGELLLPRHSSLWMHLEVAARTAVAALLVGIMHLFYPHPASFLAEVSAILGSAGTMGQTLELGAQLCLAAVSTIPLAGAVLAPAQLLDPSARPLLVLPLCALLSGGIAFTSIPPVVRKTLLALTSAGLVRFSSGYAGSLLTGRSSLLVVPVEAILRGSLCALAAALLPWPRPAASGADRKLRSAAIGVSLDLDAIVEQLARGHDGGCGARQVERRREQISGATSSELEAPADT